MTGSDLALDAGAWTVEPLWPAGAPGTDPTPNGETVINRDVDRNALGLNRAVSQVSAPSLAVYPPPEGTGTGMAVLILPGGGFHHLAIDKEGYDVARWLNAAGITGVVVKYRTVGADRGAVIAAALADTRRAIRLVRSRSRDWQIDAAQIGLLGFSAGGYLAACAATAWDEGAADAADPVARASCRPDHAALLYSPVPEEALARVGEGTPPLFLAQAADDFVPVADTLRLYGALHEAEVPAALHVYATGGHGFGLGVHGGPVAGWTAQYAAWLGEVGANRKGE